jgi:hypothetical protein
MVLGLLGGLVEQIIKGKLAFDIGISPAPGSHRRLTGRTGTGGQGLGIELARPDPADEGVPLGPCEGQQLSVRETGIADFDHTFGKSADFHAIAIRERQG